MVVVQKEMESLASLLGYELTLCRRESFLQSLQIWLRLGQTVRKGIELRKDAHLHLLGSLIGEGNSQDTSESLGILNEKFYVFYCKRKGLSTTCACLKDG